MAKKTTAVPKKTAKKAAKKSRVAPRTVRRERKQPLQGDTRPPAAPALFYRLHALLDTVRSIAAREDHLCTLLHELQTLGLVSPELTRDLIAVLDEMPAPATYLREIEATRRDLPAVSSGRGGPRARKPRKT